MPVKFLDIDDFVRIDGFDRFGVFPFSPTLPIFLDLGRDDQGIVGKKDHEQTRRWAFFHLPLQLQAMHFFVLIVPVVRVGQAWSLRPSLEQDGDVKALLRHTLYIQ